MPTGFVQRIKGKVSVQQIFYANQDGMSAKVGGGQSGATVCSALISKFNNVASPGDSAVLPPAQSGMCYEVINAGASSMNVFASSGQTMNASLNGSVAVPAGKTGVFNCVTPGTWNSVIGG